MTCYRLFMHRLRKFPGPRMAAVTKLWHVWACRDSKNFRVLDECNKRYGPFVRTGPEEITIFHPAAIELLDGAGNHNMRSDWYDLLYPLTSPIFTRDPALHIERRKIWSQALSSKSIGRYLPRILRQIDLLEKAVISAGPAGVLLNDTLSFFAFDSMAEFAFNESLSMLDSGKWHKAVASQRSALSLLGPFGCAIWAVRVAFALLPFLKQVRDWNSMAAFCNERLNKRIKSDTKEPDIAAWFLEEYHRSATKISATERLNVLRGNTISVIVGGSDTTGPSLILVCYALAKFPDYAETIHAELSAIDETDPNALAGLPHLNAFINETMRLLPSALTGGNRITPPEGIWIDDTFIPGNTKIVAPKYSIHRLDAAFERSTEFLPERWSTAPELVKDKRAFAPFGTGRRVCVGKMLALTQIRLTVAMLLKRYRIVFAPGQDVDVVEREMRDQVTAQPGPCRVIFEARNG